MWPNLYHTVRQPKKNTIPKVLRKKDIHMYVYVHGDQREYFLWVGHADMRFTNRRIYMR